MKKNYFVKKAQSVRQLIKNDMMRVDAKNYHVSMLAELWNIYSDFEKVNLCQNIVNYCKVENSFKQLKIDKDVLLISIIDSNDVSAPYAYFKNGNIELIPDSNLLREVPGRVAEANKKFLKRFLLGILLLCCVVFVVIFILF